MNSAPIVSKVWSFCTTLRDDGVSYGGCLEQLTYLIFLKMADEYAKPPHNRDVGIPTEFNWQSLKPKRGSELEGHYVTLLRELGTKTDSILGQIFTKAQNKNQDPAKLFRLVSMVDDTDWVTMGAEVKGDFYEGLREKNTEDTKSGGRPVFHAAAPHPRYGRMRPARTWYAHRRPGLRHRQFVSRRLRLHHQPRQFQPSQKSKGVSEAQGISPQ